MFSIKSIFSTVRNNISATATNVAASLREEPTQTFPSAIQNVVNETIEVIKFSHLSRKASNKSRSAAKKEVNKLVTEGKIEKGVRELYIELVMELDPSIEAMSNAASADAAGKELTTAVADVIRHIRKLGMDFLRFSRLIHVGRWIKIGFLKVKLAVILGMIKIQDATNGNKEMTIGIVDGNEVLEVVTI